MNLIESNDIKTAGKLDRFGGKLAGSLVAKLVMHIMRLNKINKLYSDVYDENPEAFLDRLIDALGVTIEINEEDLAKIPAEGAFITVSNHPFGGLDGIILIKLLSRVRPDYRVMANFLLKKIVPIKDYFLGVNPFEGLKDVSSAGGLKEALRHLSEGKPLGLFPAGEVSAYQAA
ncbi:MAG: 1-acyl-sn-glycerol-3-phosphate acyltransferase, partial [Odoribacter sp.]|nr:1-acyl-sn-glycerol-3-phosphate acyltransferase [Odoribacter sp.]